MDEKQELELVAKATEAVGDLLTLHLGEIQEAMTETEKGIGKVGIALEIVPETNGEITLRTKIRWSVIHKDEREDTIKNPNQTVMPFEEDQQRAFN